MSAPIRYEITILLRMWAICFSCGPVCDSLEKAFVLRVYDAARNRAMSTGSKVRRRSRQRHYHLNE